MRHSETYDPFIEPGEQLITHADLAMYRARKQASRFAMFGLVTDVSAH